MFEVLAGTRLELGEKLMYHYLGTPLAGLGATALCSLEPKRAKESHSLRRESATSDLVVFSLNRHWCASCHSSSDAVFHGASHLRPRTLRLCQRVGGKIASLLTYVENIMVF